MVLFSSDALQIGLATARPTANAYRSNSSCLRLELASKSEAEEDVGRRLVDLLERYSLARWTFTERVVIAEGATPCSHPVMTLGTGYPHDTALLCSYLHEQLHWWSLTCPGATAGRDRRVVEILRSRYQTLPVDPPEGCGSERSNLVHLHVCWLELEVLAHLFGWQWAERRAQRVPFYRAIYRTVVEDREELRSLFVHAGMGLPQSEEHEGKHFGPPQ